MELDTRNVLKLAAHFTWTADDVRDAVAAALATFET
jgi:hypothetical protein